MHFTTQSHQTHVPESVRAQLARKQSIDDNFEEEPKNNTEEEETSEGWRNLVQRSERSNFEDQLKTSDALKYQSGHEPDAVKYDGKQDGFYDRANAGEQQIYKSNDPMGRRPDKMEQSSSGPNVYFH